MYINIRYFYQNIKLFDIVDTEKDKIDNGHSQNHTHPLNVPILIKLPTNGANWNFMHGSETLKCKSKTEQ